MKIEVFEVEVEEQSGTSKAGKPYKIRRQVVYLHGSGRFPERFNVPLRDDVHGVPSKPYPTGLYTLAQSSFRIGQYGDLELNPFELKLEPLVEAVKPVKAA